MLLRMNNAGTCIHGNLINGIDVVGSFEVKTFFISINL